MHPARKIPASLRAYRILRTLVGDLQRGVLDKNGSRHALAAHNGLHRVPGGVSGIPVRAAEAEPDAEETTHT